jgi:hypothetical protein
MTLRFSLGSADAGHGRRATARPGTATGRGEREKLTALSSPGPPEEKKGAPSACRTSHTAPYFST